MLSKIHRSPEAGAETRFQAHATEILPDEASAISGATLAHLRQHYGENWCVLPLNDYVTEYAATISTQLSDSCYPPRSAEIVKRKHELRGLWNRMAERDTELCAVEYCYVEQRDNDDGEFDYYPSPGFEALPEETRLIVKPDELSSSIEIHYAASKQEAVALARAVCEQLRSKWYEVGRSIGTEVRPRVNIEMAIQRATELHAGAEFSIEFVSYEEQHYPVGITQKWLGPNFIETGQLFPAESFPERLRPALEGAVAELLKELAVRYCVSHWEFIITPDERIALVEGHLRPAGDRIMELIEHSTGRSPTGALCEALAQQKVEFKFVPQRSCGIFWLVPDVPLAEVTEVKVDRAVTDELCQDLYVNEEGIIATPNWTQATDSLTRFAHVMATGVNLDSVVNRCREVAQNVLLSGNRNATPASTSLKLVIDQ
jgi:hypothetical protein